MNKSYRRFEILLPLRFNDGKLRRRCAFLYDEIPHTKGVRASSPGLSRHGTTLGRPRAVEQPRGVAPVSVYPHAMWARAPHVHNSARRACYIGSSCLMLARVGPG
jgi:hypothetical protein